MGSGSPTLTAALAGCDQLRPPGTGDVSVADHATVIRKRLLEENPGSAAAPVDLFMAAKADAYVRLRDLRRWHRVLGGTYLRDGRQLLGEDPYPYGYAESKAMPETLAGYLSEQGLVRERIDPAAYFARPANV